MSKTGRTLDEFTNQYQVSKTLRFELKPVGQTAEWIKINNIIGVENGKMCGVDATRAANYKYLKKIIDEMHCQFLQEALYDIEPETLKKLSDKIITLHNEKDFDLKKDKELPKILESIFNSKAKEWIEKYKVDMPRFWQENIELLKQEIDLLSSNQEIKKKNNLIKKIEKKIKACKVGAKDIKIMHTNEDTLRFLEWKVRLDNIHISWKDIDYNNCTEMIPKSELIRFILSFDKFTTYFSGFNENRANIYDLKDLKSTSVLHRTFEQNMRFHFANIEKWYKVKKSISKYEEVYNTKDYRWKIELERCQDNLNFNIDDFFVPEAFIKYISQSGIDTYNKILGGIPELDGGKKTQGLNEYINLTRQQANAKRGEFPPMQMLYKQILSKSDTVFIEEFSDDEELFSAIKLFYKEYFEIQEDENISCIGSFAEKVTHMVNDYSNDMELEKLFLDKENVSKISQGLTGSWSAINTQLLEIFNESRSVFDKRKVFSFKDIELALAKGLENDVFEIKTSDTKPYVLNYCLTELKRLLLNIQNSWNELNANGLLNRKEINKNRMEATDQGFLEIALLKAFLDAANELSFGMKTWILKNKPVKEINSDWYSCINAFIHEYNIINIYNMTRNYVAKKPYSTDKIKVNFNNATLLHGWDKNKEKDNYSVLFEKDGLFYLGIMTENSNSIFDYDLSNNENQKTRKRKHELRTQALGLNGDHCYRKINYKYLPGASKMIPKCSTQTKEVVAHFATSDSDYKLITSSYIKPLVITKEEFLLNNLGYNPELDKFEVKTKEDKNPKKFQKDYQRLSGDTTGYKDALNKWICFCKRFVTSYASSACYNFDFKGSNQYDSLDEFYKDIDSKTYAITFDNIKESYIDKKVAKGELYLFQIYNKDFSTAKKGKGKDNLHTSYWKMLFSEENLDDVVIKLNGQAEVFFRKASLKLNEEKRQKGHHAQELKDKFDYPIIKDKRFTEDKFFFHCPIKLNFKAPISIPADKFKKSFNYSINQQVKLFLKNNSSCNIIGIDRGEKHLLYYYVIDQDSNVLESGTLNEIANGFIPQGENQERIINYHGKLDKIEKDRDAARKNWGVIENIKEMKAGYLSQVVHKLSKLIIKYNAIIVLEDLNQGFKRGRFGVEKQIYQKFEKALINKLNYLVFKNYEPKESGGYLNAFQLSGAYHLDSLKHQKQSGILFYTTASYTSTTDPVTGFIKNIYPTYSSVEKSVAFWNSFDAIIYNQEQDRFEFSYTLGNVNSRSLDSSSSDLRRLSWTVCSNVERSRYVKVRDEQTLEQKQDTSSEQIGNKGKHEVFLVTDDMKQTLDKYGVDYRSNFDIKSLLTSKAARSDAQFHKSITYLFNAIMNMRVTDSTQASGTLGNDYILSPVEPFFDSRKQYINLPTNGDANGAYNIARKGICMLNKINESEDLSKVDLLVTKQTWQNYVQNSDIVNAQLSKMTQIKN